MRRLWLLIPVAVVLAVAVVLFLRRPGDEDQIRSQLTRLGVALHVSPGSNPMLRVGRVRSEFADLFDDPTHASVAELPGTLPTGRSALADKAVEVTSYYPDLDVTFGEVTIKLDDGKTIAHVDATVHLKTSGQNGGRDARAVSFLMYKKEGAWRITSTTVWGDEGR